VILAYTIESTLANSCHSQILLLSLTISQNTIVPKCRPKGSPTHLLVVLGSGGHTAEMFYMLERMKLDPQIYTYRTYLVSSGDNFSAGKAKEFETQHVQKLQSHTESDRYSIVTVPRARRVHQSYLTAPFSTLQCFWACLCVLRGLHPDQKLPREYGSLYPDLVLTNGPATAVCVVAAAKSIRFFLCLNRLTALCLGLQISSTVPKLRTVYVESWARVNSLSTSAVLLLPLADRFLVQWPAQAGRRAWLGMKRTQYAGWLVI
jgi:beta-1,4-N-acetylglucosaminyltransferase